MAEEEKILRVRELGVTRQVNQVSISSPADSNIAHIFFDYLDPMDGVVLEILYTGRYSTPLVLGSIRGLIQGILNQHELDFDLLRTTRTPSIMDKILSYICGKGYWISISVIFFLIIVGVFIVNTPASFRRRFVHTL